MKQTPNSAIKAYMNLLRSNFLPLVYKYFKLATNFFLTKVVKTNYAITFSYKLFSIHFFNDKLIEEMTIV